MYKIKTIRKSGGSSYLIEFIDNSKIKLYDNVLLNNNILFKQELDEELYKKIIEENTKEDNYYQAVKFISKKIRSKKEVFDYLSKMPINDHEKDTIINRLINNHLINDEFYARAYVQDKFYLTSAGPNKIREELLNNNIDNTVINKLLDELDQKEISNKLEKLITKKIKINSNKSKAALMQKIQYEMKILGYDTHLINEIIDSIYIDEDYSIVNKEYNKLYHKLSNKYNGRMLQQQVYYRLRSKGFSDLEIASVKIKEAE